MQFTSMPNLFLVQNVRKSPQRKKNSQNFTQAFAEKCPQKSAGFDKGTDICGFVADICGHKPTSAMIYANVRGSLHMSGAYARSVADIEVTGACDTIMAGYNSITFLFFLKFFLFWL